MIRSNNTTDCVVSQDYELFFHSSGSVEKCMIEPANALLEYSQKRNLHLTFFVDVGMLRCFDRHAADNKHVARDARSIRKNLRAIAEAGHEIGLHVHPHWEDTRLVDGRWDFSNTRYQLRDFSADEINDIFRSYFSLLQDLAKAPIVSYRAGGFCVEPFAAISGLLLELGIDIESSVVPGAKLIDPQKGFDFAGAPDVRGWCFDSSPTVPSGEGPFVEVPVTPNTVSRFFYWGRLVDRLGPQQRAQHFGDGLSKAIGRREVLRRLLGGSRTSELSLDAAKAPYLLPIARRANRRSTWHVMGHPKLLSRRSLEIFDEFIEQARIDRFLTVAGLAGQVRAADSGRRPQAIG
ncbi:MAG: hypothetical protein KJO31_16430 [Gammaproteobacteria bacterium]|nr:hypothetical protein [Gammaproteobacteria bacterium]